MISPDRLAELAASERKENVKALKCWLLVMTAASVAGWIIGYASKHWV